MALYENVFIARQDVPRAGRSPDHPVRRARHRPRRQGHQEGVLGPADPHLPHQEEPQGPLHPAQHRRAGGGGQRDGAQDAINEDMLRYLTVRVDELEEGPSAILRPQRPRRRDRPRRRSRRPWRSLGRPPAATASVRASAMTRRSPPSFREKKNERPASSASSAAARPARSPAPTRRRSTTRT